MGRTVPQATGLNRWGGRGCGGKEGGRQSMGLRGGHAPRRHHGRRQPPAPPTHHRMHTLTALPCPPLPAPPGPAPCAPTTPWSLPAACTPRTRWRSPCTPPSCMASSEVPCKLRLGIQAGEGRCWPGRASGSSGSWARLALGRPRWGRAAWPQQRPCKGEPRADNMRDHPPRGHPFLPPSFQGQLPLTYRN